MKFLLKDFQSKNKLKKQLDETYFMNYLELEKIVKFVCEHYNDEIDMLNDIVNKYKTIIMDDIYIPPPITIGKHTVTITEHKHGDEIKTEVIDVVNLTDDEKKQYLIQAIEIFCTNNEVNYNHEIEKDDVDKKITVIWKDLQTILKDLCRVKNLHPSKWKSSLKNISSTAKSIQQIKWVKK
jgi:hypothetical protein